MARLVAFAFALVLLAPRTPEAAPLVPRSTVPADVPVAALQQGITGDVEVAARVDTRGLVDSVRATRGDALLRASAMDAVRWYVYPPQPRPVWTTATVHIDGRVDADPLPFDVRAMALEAEARGDWRGALDAWTGVANRAGKHPAYQNPWAPRLRIMRLEAKLPPPDGLRGPAVSDATGARVTQQRSMARAEHEDLVEKFESVLRSMPGWAEVYQWEAASLLGCGRRDDAMRALEIFRAGSRDSASLAIADRALAGIVAGDTIGVAEMLKKEGRQFDSEEPSGTWHSAAPVRPGK
jgi:hypothetical protein